MHAQLTDLPMYDPVVPNYLSVVWGGMQMGYAVVQPGDTTPAYADLPGGVCPCPHWFYVFEGRITAHYPHGEHEDETVRAGDVCYIPAGHVLIYEEPTKCLEFNRPEELKAVMDPICERLRERGLAAKQHVKEPNKH